LVPRLLQARRGAHKAVLAVAASLLTACDHVLQDGVENLDLGPGHFERDKDGRPLSRCNPTLSQGCSFPGL